MRVQSVFANLQSTRLQRFTGTYSLLPYLVLANLSILTVGIGLLPILPLYAGEFGASPTLVGLSMAAIYVSIAFGSWLTSWLAGKISAPALLIAAGALGVPAVIGLGQAHALWQMVSLASVVWFAGGIGLGLISVFTSQKAGENQRGKWFAWIALTNPVGSILGGLLVSWLVGSSGCPLMFLVIGLVYTIWPLVGLWKLKKMTVPSSEPKNKPDAIPQTGAAFRLLLMAALLAAITVSVNRLGISLSMKDHGFSPTAISNANVLAGLVVIPLILWLGPLSDRFGR